MFLKSIPRVAYHLAALGWALTIFIVSSIPGNELPEVDIVNFDKLVHLGVYALLAFLVYLSFRHQMRYPMLFRLAILSAFLACAFYGGTDEIHQLWIPGRTCDIWDWTSDTLGAALGVLVGWYFERWLGGPSSSQGGSTTSDTSL